MALEKSCAAQRTKIFLDIDGVLCASIDSWDDIWSKKWRNFFRDNALYIEAGGWINVLHPAAVAFFRYLVEKGFELYCISRAPADRNVPFMNSLSLRSTGKKFPEDRVYSLPQRNSSGDDVEKDLAAALKIHPDQLVNVVLIDDFVDRIVVKEQRRYGLYTPPFEEGNLKDFRNFGKEFNYQAGKHWFGISDMLFARLNNLYYVTGLIETVLEKIEANKETRPFETVLFEEQVGMTHEEALKKLDATHRFLPLNVAQQQWKFYEHGCKILQSVCARAYMRDKLILFTPDNYDSTAFAKWPAMPANHTLTDSQTNLFKNNQKKEQENDASALPEGSCQQ